MKSEKCQIQGFVILPDGGTASVHPCPGWRQSEPPAWAFLASQGCPLEAFLGPWVSSVPSTSKAPRRLPVQPWTLGLWSYLQPPLG